MKQNLKTYLLFFSLILKITSPLQASANLTIAEISKFHQLVETDETSKNMIKEAREKPALINSRFEEFHPIHRAMSGGNRATFCYVLSCNPKLDMDRPQDRLFLHQAAYKKDPVF